MKLIYTVNSAVEREMNLRQDDAVFFHAMLPSTCKANPQTKEGELFGCSERWWCAELRCFILVVIIDFEPTGYKCV